MNDADISLWKARNSLQRSFISSLRAAQKAKDDSWLTEVLDSMEKDVVSDEEFIVAFQAHR